VASSPRAAHGRLALTLLTGLLGLMLAAPAQAGLLPGILSPSDSAAACDSDARQVFLPWGDASYYVLTPGGSFEGTHGWSLKGGAKVVSGNEPFYLTSKADTRSLYLPAGSSATTPSTCFDFADWHLRFVVLNKGSSAGALKVSVVVKSLLGVVSILDGGRVTAGSRWSPSPQVSLLLTNVGALLTTDTVSFRFTPVGTSAAFQIDDVYLDPFKAR
jgi:hypothetical protein